MCHKDIQVGKTQLFAHSSPRHQADRSGTCPACFVSGKEHGYPMNRRLDGPQSESSHFGGDINLLPPASVQSPDHRAHSLTTVTKLVYKDSKVYISVNVKIQCPCPYHEGAQGKQKYCSTHSAPHH